MPGGSTGEDAKAAFAHVLWLGGASDSGKTTVARMLAERHRWQLYPCDLHEHNHFIARADPVRQPTMYGGLGKSVDEQWVRTTPDDLFCNILATNDERFPMILEDLRVMPRRPPILVEGPRLFPRLVTPLLTDSHQAIWLLPTEEFARESAARRDKPQGRFRSSDPERYGRNFLGREALLRAYIRREVQERGLTSIEIDGSFATDEVARRVEVHFMPFLARVES